MENLKYRNVEDSLGNFNLLILRILHQRILGMDESEM